MSIGMWMRRVVLFSGLATAGWAGQSVQAGPVLDLALVIDGSSSISAAEFTLQTGAYAAAFRSSEVQDLILQSASMGGIRVSTVLFSTTARVGIDWTTLTTVAQANAFADAFQALTRAGIGTNTSIARGLELANAQFARLADPSQTRIVDVSGDGEENVLNVAAVRAQRDIALTTSGVDQINGLVIGSESLRQYYMTNVIGGANAFAVRVDTFNLFEQAILRKLQIEIGSSIVPEPSSLALGALGLGGAFVAALRGRRARRAV